MQIQPGVIAALEFAQNIIQTELKRTAESAAESLQAIVEFDYHPSLVPIHEANGGFNTVVEISAKHCEHVVAAQIGSETVNAGLSATAIEELPMFGIPAAVAPYEVSVGDRDHRSFLRTEFRGLRFTDPKKVCLKFDLKLDVEVRNDPGKQPEWMLLFHGLRPATFEICADYVGSPSNSLKRVSLYVDLSSADEGALAYSSDAEQAYYETHLLAAIDALRNRILSRSTVPLCPTVSLTGQSPSNVAVTEIQNFDVAVFHVDKGDLQAIAVAFDVMPGCKGLAAGVEHFIGEFDYGVISDEFVIERVFKFKWRLGGFDRSLGLSRNIQVRRNGNPEDATLFGRLDLTSLDYVSVTTDADTRTDYIRVGGLARAVPTYIRLSDGTRLDSSDVDFGSPENTPWSVATDLRVNSVPPADPELLQFQQKAHTDAYRHVARPFSGSLDAVSPEYTRVEGVTKYAFVLGTISIPFV